jgi:hypothetical protein
MVDPIPQLLGVRPSDTIGAQGLGDLCSGLGRDDLAEVVGERLGRQPSQLLGSGQGARGEQPLADANQVNRSATSLQRTQSSKAAIAAPRTRQ